MRTNYQGSNQGKTMVTWARMNQHPPRQHYVNIHLLYSSENR